MNAYHERDDFHPRVREHIEDLYATADAIRAERRAATPGHGVVGGLRTRLGRGLIAVGTSVAGQRAGLES